MKKLFVVVAILSLATACGLQDSPRTVAEEFLGYLSQNEFEKAKALGTENTIGFLNIAAALRMTNDSLNTQTVDYQIHSVDVKGDTAMCYYSWGGDKEKLRLVRVEGRWLADVTKD
jgi:hypothetical protein